MDTIEVAQDQGRLPWAEGDHLLQHMSITADLVGTPEVRYVIRWRTVRSSKSSSTKIWLDCCWATEKMVNLIATTLRDAVLYHLWQPGKVQEVLEPLQREWGLAEPF